MFWMKFFTFKRLKLSVRKCGISKLFFSSNAFFSTWNHSKCENTYIIKAYSECSVRCHHPSASFLPSATIFLHLWECAHFTHASSASQLDAFVHYQTSASWSCQLISSLDASFPLNPPWAFRSWLCRMTPGHSALACLLCKVALCLGWNNPATLGCHHHGVFHIWFDCCMFLCTKQWT